MNKNTDDLLTQKRVKLHIFEPSHRKIWTVVGSGKEYWLDPDLDFCSCPGYYFDNSEQKSCYHLKAVSYAKKQNVLEVTTFSDDEFSDFISGIISEL